MSFDYDPGNESEHLPEMSGRSLLWLSVISALVYLFLALLIFHFFRESSVAGAFEHGFSVSRQLFIGILAGSAAAAAVGYIIRRPPVSEVLNDFYIVELVSKTHFAVFDRVQLSLFAGAGEELLFRGALQPLLGIWLTSLIFVGLHGYFKFQSFGHFLFGAMMFGLSVLLGYLFEYAGLIAAMSAHAVYDIIVLQLIQQKE